MDPSSSPPQFPRRRPGRPPKIPTENKAARLAVRREQNRKAAERTRQRRAQLMKNLNYRIAFLEQEIFERERLIEKLNEVIRKARQGLPVSSILSHSLMSIISKTDNLSPNDAVSFSASRPSVMTYREQLSCSSCSSCNREIVENQRKWKEWEDHWDNGFAKPNEGSMNSHYTSHVSTPNFELSLDDDDFNKDEKSKGDASYNSLPSPQTFFPSLQNSLF